MHWTSNNEKEMIKEWAKEYGTEELSKQILSIPVNEEDSYWCMCDEGKEIIDYEFNTAQELKKNLIEELEEDYYDDLIIPLVAATFKEKENINYKIALNNNAMVHSGDDDLTIPEFVYAF